MSRNSLRPALRHRMHHARRIIDEESATPYSLLFDGSDDLVDLGDDASIMGLNTLDAGFTIDVYWRCPDTSGLSNNTRYVLASQGRPLTGNGWMLVLQTATLPTATFRLVARDNGGVDRTAQTANLSLAEGWYYVRGRRAAKNEYDKANLAVSVNAGTEGQLNNAYVCPGTAGTDNAYLGQRGDATLRAPGHICYAHLWNADQGALGAVPSTPKSAGGATVARYRFSEGADATLGDDSANGNDGSITGATWTETVPSGWEL